MFGALLRLPFARWSFVMVAWLVLCLALMSGSVCFLPANQKASLEQLYWATGGPMWTKGWNLTLDPCADPPWYGVSCNDTGRTVIGLNLGANGLSGALSDLDLPDLVIL